MKAEVYRIEINIVVDPHWFQADPDSGTKPNPDPDPGQTLKSQKVEFLHDKYSASTVGNSHRSKTYLRRYKSLLERQETRFIC